MSEHRNKKGKTELLIEYADLSRDFEFPEEIEAAIEEDFVENPDLYDLHTIKIIATYLLICPETKPSEVLKLARNKR